MDERISDGECFECSEDVKTCGCQKQCVDCGKPLHYSEPATWMDFGPICYDCDHKRFRRAVDNSRERGGRAR